jgi:glycerophosphoryl diester phosphodiesterase
MDGPLVIAHRGASAREVENSLAAFRTARALGADAVELDVHASADGSLVVHHDETIGSHRIADSSFQEVGRNRLANGEPIPTLDQALTAIFPHMMAFVEIKALDPRWDEKLLATFGASPDWTRLAVHSFDHRIMRRLAVKRRDLRCGVLSASYPVSPLRMLDDANAVVLWQDAALIDDALVRAVHSVGKLVYAWTVDDPRQMLHLLAMGVDGLCSNHPDRARDAIVSSCPRLQS